MSIKIFLFHRINPFLDPVWPAISPSHFDKIIRYLKKRYEIVPLEETILGTYQSNQKKPLCSITFDDGYRDFMEFALPILKKHAIRASVYVITDCVNTGIAPWTYQFNHLVLNTRLHALKIDSAEIPEQFHLNHWRNEKERILFLNKISAVLKQISDVGKERVMKQVQQQVLDVTIPEGLMLNWNDIRYIKKEGIEIGSHSANHPVLSKDLHLQEIRHELLRSAQEIERETGKFPVAISYPFGIYNNDAKKIAEEIGYKMGLTVFPKAYESGHDQFEIPRIELYSEPFFKTRLRMNGSLYSLKHLFYPHKSLNSHD